MNEKFCSYKKITKIVFVIIVGLIGFQAFFWSYANKGPQSLPIIAPIDMSKSGQKIDLIVNVQEKDVYAYSLRFIYKEGDQEDRLRLKNLLDTQGFNFPVELYILKKTENQEIEVFREIKDYHRLYSWGGNSLDLKIVDIKMETGLYRIVMTSRKDNSYISNQLVNFTISKAYLGK